MKKVFEAKAMYSILIEFKELIQGAALVGTALVLLTDR